MLKVKNRFCLRQLGQQIRLAIKTAKPPRIQTTCKGSPRHTEGPKNRHPRPSELRNALSARALVDKPVMHVVHVFAEVDGVMASDWVLVWGGKTKRYNIDRSDTGPLALPASVSASFPQILQVHQIHTTRRSNATS